MSGLSSRDGLVLRHWDPVSHKVTPDGSLVRWTEPLRQILMRERRPGKEGQIPETSLGGEMTSRGGSRRSSSLLSVSLTCRRCRIHKRVSDDRKGLVSSWPRLPAVSDDAHFDGRRPNRGRTRRSRRAVPVRRAVVVLEYRELGLEARTYRLRKVQAHFWRQGGHMGCRAEGKCGGWRWM